MCAVWDYKATFPNNGFILRRLMIFSVKWGLNLKNMPLNGLHLYSFVFVTVVTNRCPWWN